MLRSYLRVSSNLIRSCCIFLQHRRRLIGRLDELGGRACCGGDRLVIRSTRFTTAEVMLASAESSRCERWLHVALNSFSACYEANDRYYNRKPV